VQPEVPPYRRYRGVAALTARVPAWLYNLGLGLLAKRQLLLLITTGRKSGRRRVTALLYQRQGDTLYVLSEAGTHADWYRNLAMNPQVQIQVGSRRFPATARRVLDPQHVARALRLFNRASPWIARWFYGIPCQATDEELLALAPQRLVVALEENRG